MEGAGIWTFSSSHHQHGIIWPRETPGDAKGSLRIRPAYLDGEPLETTDRILERTASAITHLPPATTSHTQCLLSATLRTIIPFQDWVKLR